MDEEILDWVCKDGEIVLYLFCSVKMGFVFDLMVVVDLLIMKVYGMENLCVVDVLVMFRIINGNIYVFVLMLVEKVVDIICGRKLFEF